MRRRHDKSLGVALLVLLVAFELPITCLCERLNLNDANLGAKFNNVTGKAKRWVKMASQWMVGLRDTLPALFKFSDYMISSLKGPFTSQNPWVGCVKVSWKECLGRNNGINKASILWCPFCAYYECDLAYKMGRLPFNAPDPFFDSSGANLTGSPGHHS